MTVLTPTKIRHIDYLKGAPYQEEQDILSNDGQSLFVRPWPVADPSDKDLAVYKR